MKKRLNFICWNCKKNYSLLRETDQEQSIFYVACPFCNEEAVVDKIDPAKKIDEIYKNNSQSNYTNVNTIFGLQIIPTKKSHK